MVARLERAGGFVVGIVLFLFGFSLLQPADGIVQTGVTTALAAVLTALGIGVIAAAALPHSIEVSGEQFKPLGLDVKASGGAAVFLLTLGFIYYMKDAEGAQAAPARQDQAEAADARQPGEDAGPEQAQADAKGAEGAAAAGPAPPPTAIPDNPDFAQFRQQMAPQSVNYYVAWTYCSSCCPQGPDFCDQVGIGEGASAEEAGIMAANQCALNGGVPQTCLANVQYLSASDLSELGY